MFSFALALRDGHGVMDSLFSSVLALTLIAVMMHVIVRAVDLNFGALIVLHYRFHMRPSFEALRPSHTTIGISTVSRKAPAAGSVP